MNSVIIYSHPWDKSYNSSILNVVTDSLKKNGANVDIIDLYKDNFNPVLSVKDLAIYSEGKTSDSLVKSYQKRIEQANHLFIIFPVWWYSLPAILKGFTDKVLLKNWSFDTSSTLPKGKLSFIKSTTVISTMTAPGWYHRLVYGNTVKFSFINGTLKFCGLKKLKWFNISNVEGIGDKKRKLWLDKIANHIQGI